MSETAPAAPGTEVYVVSITPFTPGGDLDERGVRRHLRRMAAAGLGVYLGGGGSGEGYVLTAAERRRLLELGAAELSGTVPVRAMGTEPRSAAEMIDFLRAAQRSGVDAAQVYSLDQGHGHRPSRREIRAYLDEVLSAVDLPAIVSTHQSVGYRIPPEMLADLAASYPHLIGVNCTHQDLRYLAEVVAAVAGRAEVHVGGPHLALTAWSLGATGFLSSEANLAPGLCADLVRAHRSGDATLMLSRFGTLLRLSAAVYDAGGIRATKAVLERLGLPGGPPRRPQLPVTGDVADGLLAAARALGVLPDPA